LWAIEALASSKNQQLAAQEQWANIVDKKAACEVLVSSVRRSANWTDSMNIVMGSHDCDTRLVDVFEVLVEKLPTDPNSLIVTVLKDIDARVGVPANLRTLAATRLHDRHEHDARTMRQGPRTQEWLQEFERGATHFATPRAGTP
jgi:hypothetical protein